MIVLPSIRGLVGAALAVPTTLGLSAVAALLHLATLWRPGAFESLVHADGGLASGEVWRLITGHLVHLDTAHLLTNLAGLLALGIALERRIGSRALASLLIVAGLAISLGVLLDPGIARYCGLSGALNAVFAGLCVLGIRDGPRAVWSGLLAAGLAKIGWELTQAPLLSATLGWPPYVPGHLIGYLVGLVFGVAAFLPKAEAGHRRPAV